MSPIKNVTLAGATGSLGPAILTALLESKLFEVTVWTRLGSTHKFPDGVRVKSIDYASESSMLEALTGQDALVSTLNHFGLSVQKLMIDACVRAGVQRFIPSEFGCDTENARIRTIPFFAHKLTVEEHLREQAAANPAFSYTLVFTAAFLDWGLDTGFLVDVKGRRAALQDGGDVLVTTTNLSTIGQAVVRILSRPAQTANRAVRIKSADLTQNQIIAIAKKIDPTAQWETTVSNTEEAERQALESLGEGALDDSALAPFLYRGLFGAGYGSHFEKNDNELLGIKLLTDTEVEAVVRNVMNA
ncbi:oxidoreductase [Phlyctema vagabunda]|uniref:Oxidoreductase n=1 Tax=Phlyctema vagabunda TaxID=108571 RepID=A0ABR4PIH9_9HELO